MNSQRLFTSESVTEGHPDKLADQVSDAILDAILEQDPTGRAAVETLLAKDRGFIAGEVTTSAKVDFIEIAREVMCEVGYTSCDIGIDGRNCEIVKCISQQSPNIAQGVDTGGAGDQGMMFGYASRETEELMPLPIMMAHKITKKLTDVRKSNPELGFRPDGKSQVTIAYDEFGNPDHIDTIVISAQHESGLSQADVKQMIEEYVLPDILSEYSRYNKKHIKYHINPTGTFVIGGPYGDTGLTGRKIIVDTYGGMARHGGGAFSGKDPSKVDRSAAYLARYVAKNVVSAGMADRCEIQLAYAIGVAEPVSISVDTFGTGNTSEDEIISIIKECFDLTPKGIINRLDLLRPIYRETAKNGHFGNINFPWEQIGVLCEVEAAI
ncbi:MAG: methionine adenosyltransferase [Armatimonadota bacterium]